jgi:hypothetical protein
MAFHDREYKVFVVLGDPGLEPPWHWGRWRVFTDLLDPVFAACRGKALVHVGQFDKVTKRIIRFGRLGWSPESHVKWLHNSPVTLDESKEWSFFYIEASAPSLPACGRDGAPPDFFVVVTNEAHVARKLPVQFNPVLFLAVAKEMPAAILQKVEDAVRSSSVLVNARLAATIDRPWGFSTGIGFTDAIQAIAHTGLFKAGQRHARPVDLSTFNELWRAF